MPAQPVSLWGIIPNKIPKIKTPSSILREQASMLEKMTEGLLTGIVTSRTNSNGELVHSLYIQAPLLADYSHLLLSVVHGSPTFPLRLEFNGRKIPQIKSLELFERALTGVLKNPATVQVINDLLQASLAEHSFHGQFKASTKSAA